MILILEEGKSVGPRLLKHNGTNKKSHHHVNESTCNKTNLLSFVNEVYDYID
jgi:hypothetical protein